MGASDNDSGSNESLYEIRLNEFVKRSEISDFDVRSLVVRCSACGKQLNLHSSREIKKHRKLDVITCKECYEFYGSSEFSQDESGYNYCTWCGNGGKLIVCDYCPNGFCNACIRRNFGRAEISETTKEGWKCYVCNKKRLKPKMKFCELIMSYKEARQKKEKKSVSPNNAVISEQWLQTAFDGSEASCKTLCRKMAKLKSIGVDKKKSLKHIVKKMEDLIEQHKTSLKNIVNTLNNDYSLYIEKQAAELESKKVETVDITNDNENSVCFIESDTEQKIDLQNGDKLVEKEDKLKAERIQAKLELLKSSSDNDSDEILPPTPKMNNGDILSADTDLNETVKVASEEANSVIEIDDTPVKETANTSSESNKSKNRANRKLDFSFSDLSDSDFDIDKPNVDELVEKVEKQVDSEMSEEKNQSDKDSYDPANDPKLKMEPRIELISCDHLLNEGATSMVISETSDMEEKLDKLVDSLCKFPRIRTVKPRVQKAKRRSGPLTPKVSVKRVLLESSSSISLSSEEDEDQKKIKIQPKFPNKKNMAKLGSASVKSDDSSSSIAIDSEEEEEDKRKHKKSKAKKMESDSSDDFIPTKKKKKYDKLLHTPLLSDDSDKDSSKKKGKSAPRKRKSAVISEDDSKSEKSTATSSSDESDNKGKKQKRKRRRIKKMGSSSDEDDEQNPDKDTPNKGRKNIRKVISSKKVSMSTKEAQAEEKERKRRIAERQKLYNKIEEEVLDTKEVVIRKMVLEVDPDSKEEIVEIHPDLVCKLKPHQVEGVRFMWECTIETVKDLNKPGSGCILAHCMGLGKTLQVITFLHTCLTNKIVSKVITRAMVICPYNTALNWANEFDYWLENVEGDILVHQLATVKTNLERLDILKYWYKEGGVIIVSYDMFRRLAAEKIPKLKKKEKELLAEYLLDPGPDIVVCDEGHVLKNEKSAISVACNKLATRRRIVLTGTPLQNNLKEYHCMVSFVKPSLLGTMQEFRNRFVNPIINGQYDDSNEYDVKLMKKRIHILHKLLDGCVQRCDYSALTKFLPPKHEFVISVKLSEVQIKMYECYLEKLTTARQDAKIQGRTLFADFNNLRSIWTHPYICHISHKRMELRKFLKDEGEEDENFICDDSESAASTPSSSEVEEDDLLKKIVDENKKKDYKTRSKAKDGEEEDEEEETSFTESKQWYHEFITEDDKYNIEISGKIVLLLEILKECERIGDKVLLFSQSLLALDMIEEILSYSHSQSKINDKEEDVLGTWVKGYDYFRMDGTTSADFRKSYIDMFNDPTNVRSRLFLISTRAGSLGTNLVGANRVIIFDTSWNPSHDVQAIFRVYRFGQLKPVYVYRLLAQGTMEEKIYDRQVTKISLSCRVVDEQQIDRHFSAADLAELYSFERISSKQRPTPMVPKDRLLAELLIKQKDWIVTYHEHDSLLENKTEEDLTEEERQAAWTEYENEKEGRAQNNFGDMDIDEETFTEEPDFSQDYDGRKIPDVRKIVEYLYERIKRENPGLNPIEFKKKLLTAVFGIRHVFQEKHVKVLRMKQEYCTRGTVPNAINKYMDELSQILKSTGEYITRLSSAINSEQAKLQQQQQQQQQNMFRGAGVPPHVFRGQVPNMVRGNANIFQMFGGRYPNMTADQRANLVQFLQKNVKGRFPVFTTTANAPTNVQSQGPVITEVDDNAPTETNANTTSKTSSSSNIISAPSTSTVTIKEIT